MNPYLLKKDCKELEPFPHIIEMALKKNSTIQFNSFKRNAASYLRLFYIVDGKFEWSVDKRAYTLYPGDMAVVLPGQIFGGEKDFLAIGIVGWLYVDLQKSADKRRFTLGNWSGFSGEERHTIAEAILANTHPVISQIKEASQLLQHLPKEIMRQEVGYITKVNHLLDDLFISIARHRTRNSGSRKDFPQAFLALEEKLRDNLAHQWSVEEMAATVGMGTTAFSERVRSYTGFSPLHYLISIRISEAIKRLKDEDAKLTDIALDVGFYSSQHFATTFKKLTGYTPREFRRENTRDK